MAGGDKKTIGISRAWAAGLLAVCMVLVAGCSGGGGVADPPGSSATAPGSSTTKAASAPTPKPTPTAAAVYKPATADGPAKNVPVPVLPAAAKEFSKKGLEEFARYWYSTLGYAFETGDRGPLMSITDPSCGTCTRVTGTVEDWYKTGGWIIGGQMRVIDASTSFEVAPDGRRQVVATAIQLKVTYMNADRSVKKAYPQAIADSEIFVASFAGGHWTAHIVEKIGKG